MKRSITSTLAIVLACLGSAFMFLQITSCKKETYIERERIVRDTVRITVTVRDTIRIILKDSVDYDSVCPVRGTFTGTSLANAGNSSAMIYTFQDNHFVTGQAAAGGPVVTFGGFRTNCDSLVWAVNYASNNSYYIMRGKFSNNRNTISGSFRNLNTVTDFGTFSITK